MKFTKAAGLFALSVLLTVSFSACGNSKNKADGERQAVVLSATGLQESFIPENIEPKGWYSRNISTVLAWKIRKNSEDAEHLFPVVLCSKGEQTESLLKQIAEKTGREFNMEKWQKLDYSIGVIDDSYYCNCTAGEINVLSDGGISCMYVGSGKASEGANWETDDGIDKMLECYGDGYILSDNTASKDLNFGIMIEPNSIERVTGLDAKGITSDSLDLTWEKVDSADWYSLLVKEVGKGSGSLDNDKSYTNSIRITGLEPDTQYAVYVRAYTIRWQSSIWT